MRCLHVKNGLIVNIVEWPTPPETYEGVDVVPAVTGTESVGQAFDVTDTLKDRRITATDLFIFKELHRLTNGIRALQTPAQAALTAAQYKAFIKTQI